MALEILPTPTPASPLKLAAAVLGGLVLGLALVGWSMGRRPPVAESDALTGEFRPESASGSETSRSDTESRSDTSEEAPGEPSGGDSGEAAAEPEGVAVMAADLAAEEPEAAPAEAAPADAPDDDARAEAHDSRATTHDSAPPTGPAATFQRGRVAYLRCGAADRRCGRDRDFEESAWAVLADLPACPSLAGVRGGGDVRIHRNGSSRELRFRDWGDDPIAAGRLQSCLEPRLTTLSIPVAGDPLVVSFRFELR